MSDMDRPLIGVVGAGTMGTGIAEVAALTGHPVRVLDVVPGAADRSRRRVEGDLKQRVDKGRLQPSDAGAALARISWITDPTGLGEAVAVIEAVPEDLALKREVFRRLDDVCPSAVFLASNTSSLSISAMAAATQRPARVVGMHFFNPVPAMALVEVIRGAQTDDAAAGAAVELARSFGKTPVLVREAPGFLVNRIARPFTGEALRILGEGRAQVTVIDRIMREAGEYRMGPFELIDLIGVDVNLAVTRAIYEAFFHDRRYVPHLLQQQMVDAGWLGRKSGRGFYEYTAGAAAPAQSAGDPSRGTSGQAAGQPGRVLVIGEGRLAVDLADTLQAVGAHVTRRLPRPSGSRLDVAAAIEAGLAPPDDKAQIIARLEGHIKPQTLILTATLTASVAEVARRARHPERILGFATLPPVARRRVVEVQGGQHTAPLYRNGALAFWSTLGKETIEVEDGTAGVFPRIQAMLSHEAIVAYEAGIAPPAEIDTAMRLGMNYPEGPIERAEAAGLDVILAVMKGLAAEHGDPRYRPSPLLRRLVAARVSGIAGPVTPVP